MALDHAHQNGILHRDIKPGNLLVDAEGNVFVTDFGLARMDADATMTMTGDLLGTLAYMSSEQALGLRAVVDQRADVYSLGATLYELLTLERVHSGDDRQELLYKIANEEPRRLRQVNRRIPEELETIISKAIEKDAADRYQAASEIADDLQAFLEHRPIAAKPLSIARRGQKWMRRHTTAVTAAIIVLLLAVVGLSVGATLVAYQRSIALENARKAADNLQLALAALEETLTESVVGELIVEPVEPKRAELERRGIVFYEEFASRNGIDPNSWPSYRLLVFNQRLGEAKALKTKDRQRADRAFLDAISRAEQLVAATNGEAPHRARQIHCIDDYAAFLAEIEWHEEAERYSAQAAELAAILLEDEPDLPVNQYLNGKVLYNTSVRQDMAGRFEQAERTSRLALRFLERAIEAEPNEIRNATTLANCRYNLGNYLARRGEIEEAAELWNQALSGWRALALVRPLTSEYHSRVGATLSNLAVLARDEADYVQFREVVEEAINYQKRALQLEPVYPLAEEFLCTHYMHLSRALEELGDHEALAAASEERVVDLADVYCERYGAAISLATCVKLASADEQLSAESRRKKLDEYATRALELLVDGRQNCASGLEMWNLGDAFVKVGDILVGAGRRTDAHQAWQSALAIYSELQAQADTDDKHEFDEAIATTKGRLDKSIPSLAESASAQSTEFTDATAEVHRE